MVDNTPDFDNMSEEEIMNWMESLAKRAGATEGFTTSADMDIAEIDPDSVVIDEPGYVPYSERSSDSPRAESRPAPPPPEPIIEEIEVVEEIILVEEDIVSSSQPVAEGGSLDWLESLAADQSDSLFNLDLSAIEVSGTLVETPAPRVNPEAWLQNLAQSQGESSLEINETSDEGDTLEWLETLAVRQGADPDELLTDASVEISEFEADVEPSAYTPFSFETPASHRGAMASETSSADPEDFLRSLSEDSGYNEEGVLATQKSAIVDDEEDAEVVDAISQGTVTAEQMQDFLERQMDRAMETPEPEVEDALGDDEEDSLEKAEIPDWILQEIGEPPVPEPPRDLPPLESILPELEESDSDTQIPAWLADASEQLSDNTFDLEALLNDDGEEIGDDVFTPELSEGDNWAEAFDVEHDEGPGDLMNPPEWYLQNLGDSQRIERVTMLEDGEASPAALELIDEPLPEEHLLPEGQPQAVPDWMNLNTAAPDALAEDESVEITAEASTEDEGMPDWLQAEVEPEAEIEAAPWWDAAPEDADTVETLSALRAESAFVPAPIPSFTPHRPLDAAASLENARSLQRSGSLDASLHQYESLIVSSIDLDIVVDDLSNLVRIHRENPVIHRLLGDGYVRQGRLQQALDTYREALNYL